tara:strand:+ start:832 stop:2151 length:1320 start_codon:yes stop_codon:yes gene_type:complete
MQTIINPLVVSVGPTNETTITPVPMTHHGGGTKKVLAVAAMVAIPIAAPAIASSIAASGVLGAAISGAMATTAGAVISSAIVGAGLGAITAKVTGGSVRAGAIGGAIAGGIGGYGARSGFGQPTTGTVTSNPNIMNANANSYGGANTFGGGADGGFMLASNTTGGLTATNAVNTGTGNVLSSGGAGFVESMKAGLSNVGQKVVSKITSPDALANVVLQVGGAAAAEALVPTPDNAEEAAAIEEYRAELEALRQKDEAAFNAKMDAAKAHMVQAGYYDPNYFGLQAANRAAISQGRKLRDFERSAALSSGGLSQGERRRAALQSGLNVQTAYDQGFGQGVGLQNQALTTATNLIPTGGVGGVNAASNYLTLASAKAERDSNAATAQKDRIMNFFGGLNTSAGRTKKEDERIEKEAAEFNNQLGVINPDKEDDRFKELPMA